MSVFLTQQDVFGGFRMVLILHGQLCGTGAVRLQALRILYRAIPHSQAKIGTVEGKCVACCHTVT